jgi:glutamate racemase
MHRPIGVFDSGIGGLGVLREIRILLPSIDAIYVADRAFAPYGERSLDEVRERSVALVGDLLGRDCQAVVIACNTASAAALRHLRSLHPEVPFIGMEPAVKPAAESTESGVIGVLATPVTFQGELYASVVDRHAAGVRVVAQPAPGLVELVEAGRIDDAVPLLERYLVPMIEAGIDRLVLGCTHFPALMRHIRTLLPDGVAIVDPAPAVARQVARLVESGGAGQVTHLATVASPPTAVATRPLDITALAVR